MLGYGRRVHFLMHYERRLRVGDREHVNAAGIPPYQRSIGAGLCNELERARAPVTRASGQFLHSQSPRQGRIYQGRIQVAEEKSSPQLQSSLGVPGLSRLARDI
jgi:hypothetical protein